MSGEQQGEMDCTQFEALLSEALDGALGEPVLAGFRAHAAACADCGPMLAAAQIGMSWLKSLPEVEPPRNLVHNILIATSGAQAAAPIRPAGPTSPWRDRLHQWTRPLALALSAVRQPRFALSLGMAFFSVMVLLNAAGLHLSSLRPADLRPSAIQENLARTYNETTARAVRYYDNIRLVYEIESRVREIRNATREEDQQEQRQQEPEKPKDRKYRDDNSSGNPDQKRDRYSRRDQPAVLAGSSLDHPANPISHRRDA
ncbi:MAG: zf-HC2 domain-containing protein [Terriglobales bacterium]